MRFWLLKERKERSSFGGFVLQQALSFFFERGERRAELFKKEGDRVKFLESRKEGRNWEKKTRKAPLGPPVLFW